MDTISFGLVFLELVFGQLDRLPGPGEEVFTDDFAISCGGAVTSATAAADGGVKAGMCTMLGDDFGTQVVSEHCAAVGVNLGPSVQLEGAAAGITVVLNFDDDRGFVTHLPPRVISGFAEVERWRTVLRRERPTWCYLHAGRWVPDFLREARELGSKIMLDTALGDARDPRERDTVIECVGLADVFVPNAAELLALTGSADLAGAVSEAATWGASLVVTRGAAGALVTAEDGSVTEVSDGVRDVQVRDLTGAGDSFAGAMMAALIGGASLTEAAVVANTAGSLAVSRLGAVGAVSSDGAGAGWPLSPMAVREVVRSLQASENRGMAGAVDQPGGPEGTVR
ncbi:MAG TPA: carbohydrate kinase family protein [Streptosporangiaceae bacterium]